MTELAHRFRENIIDNTGDEERDMTMREKMELIRLLLSGQEVELDRNGYCNVEQGDMRRYLQTHGYLESTEEVGDDVLRLSGRRYRLTESGRAFLERLGGRIEMGR